MIKFLNQFKEEMPAWLKNYQPGDNVSFKDFMSGRIGYYPGSGEDGNLVSVGNQSHCVHSFIYLDYLLKREELEAELKEKKYKFNGYHEIGEVEWTEKDIFPKGKRVCDLIDPEKAQLFVHKDETPYYVLKVFERDADRDDSWGAERFAVAFFMTDGIDLYFQLFCGTKAKAPFLFLLQDHGFGCNYDSFGRGGLLDRIISRYEAFPDYVICDRETWRGYQIVPGTDATRGGMWNNVRYLYERTK